MRDFSQVLMPISMGFLTRLVAGYGEIAVAALRVANRIEMFALAPLMALGSVLVRFTGQNNGAKQPKRILEGVSFSNFFSLGLGVVVFILFLLFRYPLASLFNDSKEVIGIVGTYLVVVSIGFGFQGITSISGSTFSTLNKPFNAAGVNSFNLNELYLNLIFEIKLAIIPIL